MALVVAIHPAPGTTTDARAWPASLSQVAKIGGLGPKTLGATPNARLDRGS